MPIIFIHEIYRRLLFFILGRSVSAWITSCGWYRITQKNVLFFIFGTLCSYDPLWVGFFFLGKPRKKRLASLARLMSNSLKLSTWYSFFSLPGRLNNENGKKKHLRPEYYYVPPKQVPPKQVIWRHSSSGCSVLKEVWPGRKSLLASLIRTQGGFYLKSGMREKRIFFSTTVHEGRPSRKLLRVEFDTPESHECMVADLTVIGRRVQLSQNSGSPNTWYGKRFVEPDSREGLGKHGENCDTVVSLFLSRPICPLSTVLFS